MIIVCRRFDDGRLRFWNAGCFGHEDVIGGGGADVYDCDCAMGIAGRDEREEEEEGCAGVYADGGRFRPRLLTSSLGVRRCEEGAASAPLECRLCWSEL